MFNLKRIIFNVILGSCVVSLFACAPSNRDSETYTDLQITWVDNSNNEDEFIIERRIESNVDYGTFYYVEENTTSFVDVDVQTGESYCYRISASNEMGESHSSEVCVDL
jgi:hypothetical protein